MSQNSLPNIGKIATDKIDGLSVRYAKSGIAKGIPIVLTAPWPESIYSFYHLAPVLSAKFSLLLVDLPGFGHSESRPNVMAPEAMGDFFIKFLDHFGINRTHVIAPDVGTLAILFAAAKQPALFESLVIGGGEQAARLTPSSIIEDFRAASAGRRLEEASQFVRGYITDCPKLEPLLSNIKIPSLIIAGKNDPIVPPVNAQFLSDRLPNNQCVLLNAEHRVWEEAANDYADTIVSWFDSRYKTTA